MKKRLFSVAIMLLTLLGLSMQASAQAPTLTQKWKITEGLPAANDARQMTVLKGKIYIQNKVEKQVQIWDQNGKSAESLASGLGTNICHDEAGNIIVRIGSFPNSFANGSAELRIFPADGSTHVDVILDGIGKGRSDFFGNARGNVLDPDNGGVLYVGIGNELAVIPIIGGVQDVDNTYTLAINGFIPGTSSIIHATGETDLSLNVRATGNTIIKGALEGESFTEIGKFVTPKRHSLNGHDIFTMGGIDYIIYPISPTTEYKDGFAIALATTTDLENKVLVTHDPESATVANTFQSDWLFADVISDTKANIYQYYPGGYIAMYEFEIPVKEEEALYMIGQIDKNNYTWGANVGFKMEMAEKGIYKASVRIAESAIINGSPAFGFATKLGANADDWTTLNANRYGVITDGTVLENGEVTPLVKAEGAFKMEGWAYDVIVDMNAMTVMCTANPPIPAPDPDQLYIIGEVEGAEMWKPNSGVKLDKQADGTYAGTVTFNGAGTWGLVEILGATPEDWDTPNAKRFGPAIDKEMVKKGIATTMVKNQNAFMILVDKYNVVVDIKANTVTCTQVVTPSDRAVYAYGLTAKQEEKEYILSYTLNAAATDVAIKVTDNTGTQVGEIINAPATKGSHSIAVAKASYPGENLSWEVTTSGTAIDGFNRITPATADYAAFAPYGVDVDRNPESKLFGNVYVTNSGAGSCSKPVVDCIQGLYVYDPALQRMTIEGINTFTGGVKFETTGTFFDPRTVKVAFDGSIYVGCNAIGHSPLYKVDPTTYNVWTPVFEGTQNEKGVISNSNGDFVAGGTMAMSFIGAGKDQKLFVVGTQNRAASYSANDMFMSIYDLGYKSTWDQVPTTKLSVPIGLTNTQANSIVADSQGGYWVAQHRGSNNLTEPTLMHFAADGTRNYVRFSANLDVPNFCAGGGLAVNKEGNLMAISNSGAGAPTKGAIALYTVTYDAQNTPTLTFIESFSTELGTNINSIAFDYAGNIHAVSNSGECYIAYSCKKANNTETVKCSALNLLNAKMTTNAPTNLVANQEIGSKTVNLTWDAPAEGDTPLYYTVSVASGEYVKVFDGITETSFINDLSWVKTVTTFNYTVSAVYANNDVKASEEVTISFNPFSSVEDINSTSEKAKVYPNPTTGIVNIESSNGIYSIEIYNASSQLVNQVNADGSETTQCDITDQPAGIYFFKVNGKTTVKVIKK